MEIYAYWNKHRRINTTHVSEDEVGRIKKSKQNKPEINQVKMD